MRGRRVADRNPVQRGGETAMSGLRQEMREYNLDVELEDADADVVSDALTANMAAIELIARLREKLDALEREHKKCLIPVGSDLLRAAIAQRDDAIREGAGQRNRAERAEALLRDSVVYLNDLDYGEVELSDLLGERAQLSVLLAKIREALEARP